MKQILKVVLSLEFGQVSSLDGSRSKAVVSWTSCHWSWDSVLDITKLAYEGGWHVLGSERHPILWRFRSCLSTIRHNPIRADTFMTRWLHLGKVYRWKFLIIFTHSEFLHVNFWLISCCLNRHLEASVKESLGAKILCSRWNRRFRIPSFSLWALKSCARIRLSCLKVNARKSFFLQVRQLYGLDPGFVALFLLVIINTIPRTCSNLTSGQLMLGGDLVNHFDLFIPIFRFSSLLVREHDCLSFHTKVMHRSLDDGKGLALLWELL